MVLSHEEEVDVHPVRLDHALLLPRFLIVLDDRADVRSAMTHIIVPHSDNLLQE